MAFSASNSSKEPRSFSIGPVKCQIMTYSAASLDVAGSFTADALREVFHVVVDGLEHTAAPSFSGNVVTLAFTDPGATVYGTILVIGR